MSPQDGTPNEPSIVAKVLVPLIIIGGLIGVARIISANPPEAPRRGGNAGPALVVETVTLDPQSYDVRLQSYGTVQPRTQSQLVSQVSGQIVAIDPAFREGGVFSRGDVLVRIDARDFAADVDIARASLLDAEQTLAEAEARAEQALVDWQALGNEGEPPALVARIPQLRAAEARVASAQATLTKAELSLERATIRAPFDGRVLTQLADVGQVVAPNTPLGEIYATDSVEVRLPLRDRDLPFVDLPTQRATADTEGGEVVLTSTLGDHATWQARLVRTEGAIDQTARQLHVIAQLVDIDESSRATPITIGQYVTAEIEGKTIADALVVPNEVLSQGTYLFVVDDNILNRRKVDVLWQNDTESIVAGGVRGGEQVVTTQLGQVTTGTRVQVLNAPDQDRSDASTGSRSGSPGVAGARSQ
ncbi:MAG: efflux RND transporter periplasmic adaptor subunit [Pseudomonadota bacterium]